uniref:Nuclear receptor domain-containing protein n=1 Tax=Sphaeramia orbicularis TaxID=375764 RepID=A0A673AYP5_9TELE
MSEKAMDEENVDETLTLQNEEETEDEEPKFCGVCGDEAKGYHFNALTCEGCKGFFRRTIKRSDQLRCPFLNKCIITKNNRRSCQACRFQKCKAIGMRKDMVMSEEKVQERRIRIKKNKMRNSLMQLSSQQQEMIEELLSGHRSTFDPAFSHFSGFRPMDRNTSSVSEYNQYAREACDPRNICPENTCTAATEPASHPRTSSAQVSNMRPGGQIQPAKGSNLALGMNL